MAEAMASFVGRGERSEPQHRSGGLLGFTLLTPTYALIRSGVNGWLAGAGKEADFVSAVRVVAFYAAARRSVADAARATARRLDWGDITARFESVLEGAIGRAEPVFGLPGLQPAA